MAASSFILVSNKEELKKEFVGKSLKDIAAPAAVLDLGKVKTNCDRMLNAAKALDFGWRAHIKTHKTTELTRLQVGETGPVDIIVSTILEAENVLPLLLEYQAEGRAVNLLYSFPVSPGSVARLSTLSKAIGPHNLSLLVDHSSQLASVTAISQTSGSPPSIFIKIDMGTHRAGVLPQSSDCSSLINSLLALQQSGTAKFLGVYAHAGHSYSGSSSAIAIDYLRQELEALLVTAAEIQSHVSEPSKQQLVLSVGATPTTTSVRNLLINNSSPSEAESEEGRAIHALQATIATIKELNCKIEIHAGVYCVLDLQQLATHALPSALLSWDDLAFTILAEVASLYPGRGENGSLEALTQSGCLALGREPCKAYSGFGILTPWNRPDSPALTGSVEEHSGWQVAKVSQEHGILKWKGKAGTEEKLEIGQLVRIWPNHACVAGAGFGWYLIVDGSDEIVDVWPRWTGW